MRRVKSLCHHCALGCGLYLLVNREIEGVDYRLDHPFNEGSLCDRGNLAHSAVYHERRIAHPLIKEKGGFRRATWNEALSLIANELEGIRKKHGADSISILVSGVCVNEELCLIRRFAESLGTRNVYHPYTSIASKRFQGGTNRLSNVRDSDCIFILGNPFEQNPVSAKHILRAKYEGNASIIVADVRYTPTAWFSNTFLRYRVGSEAALLCYLMKTMIEKGLYDEKFVDQRTSNFDDFRENLEKISFEELGNIVGLNQPSIVRAAGMIAKAKRPFIVYTSSISQLSNVSEVVGSLTNLALLINVFKEGAGLYPLEGPGNIQGAIDMGIGALESTEGIRALIALGDMPSWSGLSPEFIAVSQTFLSENISVADVVLPSAHFFEKRGRVTSSERVIEEIEKAVDPLGEAKTEFWIVKEIAKRMGYGLGRHNLDEVWKGIRKKIEEPSETSKRFSFRRVDFQPKIPQVSEEYPFLVVTEKRAFCSEYELISGAIETITGRPTSYVEINAYDAKELGIETGKHVKLRSPSEELEMPAVVSDFIPKGILFVPDYRLCIASLEGI